MSTSPVKLVSNNIHNFRHSEENPVVVGVKSVTPAGLQSRMCFQVLYLTDMKTDYIPIESVESGDWTMKNVWDSELMH